jgi:hypothetical protein
MVKQTQLTDTDDDFTHEILIVNMSLSFVYALIYTSCAIVSLKRYSHLFDPFQKTIILVYILGLLCKLTSLITIL